MSKKISFWLINLLIVFVVSASFLTGCKKKDPSEKINYNANDSVAAKIITVDINSVSVIKTYSGNLEGQEQANVYTKIPERVVGLPISVGSSVTKGQIIISLDKSGSTSSYYQLQASMQNAAKDLERMKALFKEGAISQQMLDGVQTQYNVTKANFEAARSAVDLTAPISGIVTALNVHKGDVAQPGSILVTISSIGQMKAVFGVGESDLSSIKKGQAVKVYTDIHPDKKANGKISEVNTLADVTSRSFQISALFSNTKDKLFKPGMFVRVDAELHTANSSLVVPNESIITDEGRTYVYVVDAYNKATQRDIKLGLTNGKITEVLGGLNKGDKVVTTGINLLKDGKYIVVVP